MHGFLHRLGINVTFEVLFAPYSLRSTFAHLVVAGFNGITSVKWVPMADFGRVSSAPNCFESALTRRAPSRLLVVGSKPRARPTPKLNSRPIETSAPRSIRRGNRDKHTSPHLKQVH